jgi:hypothetical protein
MSEDMLCLARENSINADTSILFLCQKAEELDLYGTVDGAICCLDSLNHITDINLLKKAIYILFNSLYFLSYSLNEMNLNKEK